MFLIFSLACVMVGIAVPAYGQAPVIDWIAHHDGAFRPRLDVDQWGNASVAFLDGYVDEIVTVRYNPNGVEQWRSSFDLRCLSCRVVSDVVVDMSGNTVVVANDEYFEVYPIVLKYDSLGVLQWSWPLAGLEGGGNGAVDVETDTNGYVYLLSDRNTNADSFGGSNYIDVRKFDPEGNLDWLASFGNAFSRDMALDRDGNIYVVASTWFLGPDTTDCLVVKFDQQGELVWARTYDGPASVDDAGNAIAVDAAGNVYVTGSAATQPANDDYLTIKYDAQGTQQWVALYDRSGQDEAATEIVIDPSGNTYVTGTSDDDYTTIKYGPDGEELWIGHFNGKEGLDDAAGDLVIDHQDNIYVTGSSRSLRTGEDFCTVKYTPTGKQEWVAVYDGGEGRGDYVTGIGLDRNGGIYLAGENYRIGGSLSGSILKYRQSPGAISLLFPSPGQVITADTVALVWLAQEVDQVDRYWLEVDKDSLFATPFVDSLVVDTTYTLSSLNHNTIYWWRVRAHNFFGWGSFSNARSFFAFQEIPAPPMLASPANGASNVPLTTLLDWDHSPGTERYGLQLSDTSDFSTLVLDEDSLSETSLQVVELSGQRIYSWRVSASNALGSSSWSEVWNFRTTFEQPLLAFPSNGAVDLPPVLSVGWHPVRGSPADTLFYHMQLSLDIQFSETIVDDSTIVDTLLGVGPLDSTTTYYWRVRAKDGFDTGPWSDVWSFRTIFGVFPAQVTLHLPENGSLVTELSAHCRWHPGFHGVDAYWFEWASDSMFTDSSVDSTGKDTLSVAFPIADGETYWWRVRAHNNSGWGSFSEAWSFLVLLTGVSNENSIPAEYSLSQNYPNPFNPSTVIRYGLPSQSHVSLEVFNMLGQRVASLVDEVQDPGYYEVTFERADLSSGLYFYRLTASNFVETRKLVLLK